MSDLGHLKIQFSYSNNLGELTGEQFVSRLHPESSRIITVEESNRYQKSFSKRSVFDSATMCYLCQEVFVFIGLNSGKKVDYLLFSERDSGGFEGSLRAASCP